MALADRILTLKLVSDVSSISSDVKKTTSGLDKMGSKFKGMAGSAASWTKAMGIGLAIEGVDMAVDAISNAWDGFREGEKVAAQLGVTWKQLGKDGDSLQGVIDMISESTRKLGTSDDEAIAAFNSLIRQTGNTHTAMERLRIAQDLVANGSAPNLKSAIKIIDGAAKGSSKIVDKWGLKSKTAGGRIRELGKRVKGAAATAAKLDPLGVFFNNLGEDLEGIVGSLAQGDIDGALSAIGDVGRDIGKFFDQVGPKITGVLDKLTGGVFSSTILPFWQKIADAIGPKLGGAFDATVRAIGALGTAFSNVMTFLKPVYDILAPAVAGSIGFALDLVSGTLNTIADFLNGDFDKAWTDIQDTIGNVVDDVTTTFNNVLTAIETTLAPILTAAQGIGNAIWAGVMNVLFDPESGIIPKIQGMLDSISQTFEGALETIRTAAANIGNAIHDAIMGPVDAITGAIQGVVDGVTGIFNDSKDDASTASQGWADAVFSPIENRSQTASNEMIDNTQKAINKIESAIKAIETLRTMHIPLFTFPPKRGKSKPPGMASGGIVRRPTLALIGEAGPEAVVPLRHGTGGLGGNITVNVHTGVGDPIAIGREVDRVLRAYRRRTGVAA